MQDDIWTNQDGWAFIAVPPCSYSVWGPAGITGGFAHTPCRTLQQFELADDLGDSDASTPRYGGYAIAAVHRTAGAIWPAAASRVNLFVYADALQQVELLILPPNGAAVVPAFTGTAGPDHPLVASFNVDIEGRHCLTAKLSTAAAPPARLYICSRLSGSADSNSKCNKYSLLIYIDRRSSAVGKWETLFVFHLFHGCFEESPVC